MQVTPDFEYALVDKIYQLCNREQYFTCGTNSQYDLLFTMAKKPEMSVRDIAVMIFTCSEKASLGRILNDINGIMNEIEEAEAAVLLEEQEAAAKEESLNECVE